MILTSTLLLLAITTIAETPGAAPRRLWGQAATKYKRIGCFKDTWNRALPTLEGKDARLDGIYYYRSDPIEKCYQAAKARGFRYFAVQDGGGCYAGNSGYDKYGWSRNCAGGAGEGGAWANDVYATGLNPTMLYKRIGCFKDTWNRALPTLEGKDGRLDGSPYGTRTHPIEKCYQAAKDRGFRYFAVQAGGWCAAGNDAHYDKYGKASNCAGGVGGAWANDVYTTGLNPMLYKRIGCFKDTWNRALPTLEGKDGRLDGSPYGTRADPIEKCYQAAKDRGFRYFAVQAGGWCAAGNSGYDRYGRASNCAGGAGGAWANDVYTTGV